MKETGSRGMKTIDMTYVALFSVLIVICSWISVPTAVPFTMQTFALFTIIGLLGTKKAFISTCVYLLLGTVGLPVFSGFKGGIGHLFGVTGGYLIGFLLTVLISGTLLNVGFKKRKPTLVTYCISMFLGLLACYGFGTAWYILLYANSTGSISVTSVLSICVFPFVLTDIVKIFLSYYVCHNLKKTLVKL